MKEIIGTLIIVSIIASGIYAVIFGIGFVFNEWNEKHFQRYLTCLERTEKLTCDKVFYKYKTQE